VTNFNSLSHILLPRPCPFRALDFWSKLVSLSTSYKGVGESSSRSDTHVGYNGSHVLGLITGKKVAEFIKRVLKDSEKPKKIKLEVAKFVAEFQMIEYCFE